MEEEYTDYKVLFDMFDSSVNVVQADDLIGDADIILDGAVEENGNEFDTNEFESDLNDVKTFDSKYDFVIKNDGGVYIRNVIKLLTNKLNRDISVDELFCALIVNSDITKEWLVEWLKSRKIDNIIYSDTDVKITRDEFLECVKKLKRKNNYNRTSFVEYYNSKLFKECKTIQDYFNKAISEDEFDYYEHLYIEEPLKKIYTTRLDEYKNCDSSYIQEIENININIEGKENEQFFKNKKFEKETITKCIEIYKNAHNQTNPTYDDLVQMCNDIMFKKVVEGIITPSEYERIKTNKKQIQYYIRLYELDDFIRKMDYKSRKERMEEDEEDTENILNLIN